MRVLYFAKMRSFVRSNREFLAKIRQNISLFRGRNSYCVFHLVVIKSIDIINI